MLKETRCTNPSILCIGALFRVVTPHSSVLLRITSRLVFSLLFDLRGNLGIVKEKSFLLSDYTTTMVILLWKFLMFHQNLFSPQVKRSLIISNKLACMSRVTNNWMLTVLPPLGGRTCPLIKIKMWNFGN